MLSALHMLYLRKHFMLVWQKVLTAVVTKIRVFWDMPPAVFTMPTEVKQTNLVF
jgi:hypothetical protein